MEASTAKAGESTFDEPWQLSERSGANFQPVAAVVIVSHQKTSTELTLENIRHSKKFPLENWHRFPDSINKHLPPKGKTPCKKHAQERAKVD